MATGQITQNGKRLVANDLLPEFRETIDFVDGIFIPGEVYSSKNSKMILPKYCGNGSIWTFKGRPARPSISNSAQVSKYKKEKLPLFTANRELFLEMVKWKALPYIIEFTFYRATHGRFDFHNMCQLICDIMVDSFWIDDDNIDVMLPVPPLPPKRAYHISKEKPGVLIRVL
jgi:hypothetical protein